MKLEAIDLLMEALAELEAMTMLPTYLPPRQDTPEDEYFLRGAVIEFAARIERRLRDALADPVAPLDLERLATAVWEVATAGNRDPSIRSRPDDTDRRYAEALVDALAGRSRTP